MKEPHDCENLNDFLCWHADLFHERVDFRRRRNFGDITCFKLARLDAQKRFPLEGEEVARIDEYVATKFGIHMAVREPEGRPMPVLLAG
jgi:hypothetical protein